MKQKTLSWGNTYATFYSGLPLCERMWKVDEEMVMDRASVEGSRGIKNKNKFKRNRGGAKALVKRSGLL